MKAKERFKQLKGGVQDKWNHYKEPIKVFGAAIVAIGGAATLGFVLGRKDILEGESGSFGFYEDPENKEVGIAVRYTTAISRQKRERNVYLSEGDTGYEKLLKVVEYSDSLPRANEWK